MKIKRDVKIEKTPEVTQEEIDRRIKALKNAYANNLLEGVDIGYEYHMATLQRAKEPISTEEFVRRENKLLDEEYGIIREED